MFSFQNRGDAAEHLHHAVGTRRQQAGKAARCFAVGTFVCIHRHNTAAHFGGDEDIVFMGKPVRKGRQVSGVCRQILHVGPHF